MEFLNLRLYTPSKVAEGSRPDWETYNAGLDTALSIGAEFYMDDLGRDFYKVRDIWPDNGKWKLAFREDGWVFCHSKDINGIITHVGVSIVEVDELPDNFNDHIHWYWKDGKLVEDLEKAQTTYRNRILIELDASINVLQNRVDDDDAEERHVEELAAKRKLRVALRKLDMKVKVESWPTL